VTSGIIDSAWRMVGSQKTEKSFLGLGFSKFGCASVAATSAALLRGGSLGSAFDFGNGILKEFSRKGVDFVVNLHCCKQVEEPGKQQAAPFFVPKLGQELVLIFQSEQYS
jgi:hypothetical protein